MKVSVYKENKKLPMKHIKLFESWCEGDIDDIQSYFRKECGEFETLHYGFDYIEIRLKDRDNKNQDKVKTLLLKKFDNLISEIYTEETGWFKYTLRNEIYKTIRRIFFNE